jgi:hypothetical protein
MKSARRGAAPPTSGLVTDASPTPRASAALSQGARGRRVDCKWTVCSCLSRTTLPDWLNTEAEVKAELRQGGGVVPLQLR